MTYGDVYRFCMHPETGLPREMMSNVTFAYKKVIFNDPATIIIWADGTKTVVKCAEGESFDPVKGLAVAFMKHALGDGNVHNKIIRKEAIRYYINSGVFSKLTGTIYNLEGPKNDRSNALSQELENYELHGSTAQIDPYDPNPM